MGRGRNLITSTGQQASGSRILSHYCPCEPITVPGIQLGSTDPKRMDQD